MKFWIAVALFSFSSIPVAVCQDKSTPQKSYKYELPKFDFDSVFIAQIKGEPGKESIEVTQPEYQEIPRTISVLKQVNETRTQTYTVEVKGKKEERVKEITVPVTITETVEVLEKVADSVETESAPVDSTIFYDASGKVVELAALRKRLKNRTGVVFLGNGPLAKGFLPVNPLYASILREDLLFFVVIPTPGSDGANSPAPAAPEIRR